MFIACGGGGDNGGASSAVDLTRVLAGVGGAEAGRSSPRHNAGWGRQGRGLARFKAKHRPIPHPEERPRFLQTENIDPVRWYEWGLVGGVGSREPFGPSL